MLVKVSLSLCSILIKSSRPRRKRVSTYINLEKLCQENSPNFLNVPGIPRIVDETELEQLHFLDQGINDFYLISSPFEVWHFSTMKHTHDEVNEFDAQHFIIGLSKMKQELITMLN